MRGARVARSGGHAFGGHLRADALGRCRQPPAAIRCFETVLEIAHDLIEADPSQPHRRLALAPGIRDDHDRLLAAQHRAGPRGVLTAETDIDAPGEVRGRKLRRVSHVQNLRATRLQRQHAIER